MAEGRAGAPLLSSSPAAATLVSSCCLDCGYACRERLTGRLGAAAAGLLLCFADWRGEKEAPTCLVAFLPLCSVSFSQIKYMAALLHVYGRVVKFIED